MFVRVKSQPLIMQIRIEALLVVDCFSQIETVFGTATTTAIELFKTGRYVKSNVLYIDILHI